MKYFPCPRWKLWNISGRKVHGRHVRMKGKSWKGLQLSQGQAAAADCIEDSHGGGELKISYGMPPRPPQQMWQTPYPESCDSPLRGARLKWRSRWPTEIKNGQSPLTPIGTSLRQMSRPKTLSGMPSFIASLKLSASSAAASSNASGLSEYVSFKAANASHRVVSSTASNKLANWQFQKDKGSSKHHIASAGWGSAAPILISKTDDKWKCTTGNIHGFQHLEHRVDNYKSLGMKALVWQFQNSWLKRISQDSGSTFADPSVFVWAASNSCSCHVQGKSAIAAAL